VTSQHSELLLNSSINQADLAHEDAVDVEGLDHIFRWASEVVADGEDARVRSAREKRVRRQVLELVQKSRDQRLMAQAQDENSYLQRRVIALLQKLQEVTEECGLAKSVMVSQWYMLQRIPQLESEVKQLKSIEYEREAAVQERRYLMDALAKLKVDRDLLDEMLTATEQENVRLAQILTDTRSELAEIKARRWWHVFLFWKKKK
jgi:hypothetical protein